MKDKDPVSYYAVMVITGLILLSMLYCIWKITENLIYAN